MSGFLKLVGLCNRAFKKPTETGRELRANYWLIRQDMLVFVALFTLLLVVQDLSVPHEPIGLGASILGTFLSFLVFWFIWPVFDWIGYWMVGVRLTYRQARELMVASMLPFLSPYWWLILFGLGVVTAYMPALKFLFLIAFVGLLIKILRLRKNLLNISMLNTIIGLLGIPLTLIVVGIFIGFGKIGQDIIWGTQARHAHDLDTSTSISAPLQPDMADPSTP